METASAQRRQGDRRRLWERRLPAGRRSGQERRRAERRVLACPVVTDRRVAPDRRRADRRGAADRRAPSARRNRPRRQTNLTPYTAEEIAELRRRLAAPRPAGCPACGSGFALGPARRRGADLARRVVCLGCGRAAVVPNSCGARILVIAQNDTLRDVLRTMLVGAGHEVVETTDAAVALIAYQAAPADVVIIDVYGPGRMEATEFLRRLRREFPDARVVTMAGRPSYRVVDPLAVTEALGAARTMRMPISRDDLLRIVAEVRP